jgi:hypothetical protein
MGRRGRGARRDATTAFLGKTALPVAAMLAMTIPSPAPGQGPAPARPPLQLDLPIQSEIAATDPTMNDNQHSREFRLWLDARQRIQIDMDGVNPGSDPYLAFDPYLRLLDPAGREVAHNDDRGDGTPNSRILYLAPFAGDYVVRAQGFFNHTGRFTLRATAAPVSQPQPLTAGSIPVAMDTTSAIDSYGGVTVRIREFVFSGSEGERVLFDVGSATVEARLRLVDQEGAEIGSTHGDERFAPRRLLAQLARTGTYRLIMTSAADQVGYVSLVFSRGPPVTETPLALQGRVIRQDRLTLGSPAVIAGGTPARFRYVYKLYRLELRAGDIVRITARSSAFEPVVAAGGDTLLGFGAALEGMPSTDVITADIDSRPAMASSLTIEAAEAGIVMLRVRSPTVSVGDFTLAVEPVITVEDPSGGDP